MSTASTPNDSPVSSHIQPLHNPQNAAHVVVPQAPLGNATNGPINQAPGLGAKALLAKRFAKGNPTYVSPTDNMTTPVTQKINAAKKKHFNKGAKPMQSLFQKPDVAPADEANPDEVESPAVESTAQKTDTDDNPF
ncbi:hypothetical protein OF83DRAFT_1085406 [Amylostereum chailletii]|nr:hypothetical protein OF83DRAFT_1085406 [Amylostereum chailletii]